jgi:ethanolamine utilization protein EutN
MFLGRVIGHVWATKKWPELSGLKLLVVRPHTLAELGSGEPPQQCDDAVIAADLLGACVGEDVILAYGHAARVGLEELAPGAGAKHPVDAAVVAIVDRYEVNPEAGEEVS